MCLLYCILHYITNVAPEIDSDLIKFSVVCDMFFFFLKRYIDHHSAVTACRQTGKLFHINLSYYCMGTKEATAIEYYFFL